MLACLGARSASHPSFALGQALAPGPAGKGLRKALRACSQAPPSQLLPYYHSAQEQGSQPQGAQPALASASQPLRASSACFLASHAAPPIEWVPHRMGPP